MFSHRICFVCGSLGADYTLHIKARNKGSYFPFLENHDPPKGALRPTASGEAVSCRVCYSFLLEQWDSFERSKTPAIKRLYWLKRCDDGQFTGAEMKLQGEYAAQVMGLQYQPGSVDLVSPTSSNSSFTPRAQNHFKFEPEDTNGALDLTVAGKPEDASLGLTTPPPQKRKHKDSAKDQPSVICFLCRTEQTVSALRFIASKPHSEGEPFFPFLQNIKTPKGAMPLTDQGFTRVCSGCRKTLSRTWRTFDSNGVPESERIYKVSNEVFGSCLTNENQRKLFQQQQQQLRNDGEKMQTEVCYLCAQATSRKNIKTLLTQRPRETDSKRMEMYFPFIAGLKTPRHAQAIDSDGLVLSCRPCFDYLKKQWLAYDDEKVPHNLRRFILRPLTSQNQAAAEMSRPPQQKSLSGTSRKPSSAKKEKLKEPLNIQIAPPKKMKGSPNVNSGLLAIAPTMPQPILLTGSSQTHSFFPGYPLNVPTLPQPNSRNNDAQKNTENNSNTIIAEDVNRSTEVKICCFLCGLKCTGANRYTLHSYPRKHEVKKQKESTEPFFPFLNSIEPKGSSKNTSLEDGVVNACMFCYHSLLAQWHSYEESDHPKDCNRWMRKYDYKTFVCHSCGKPHGRQAVNTLSLKKFSFLKHLQKPPCVLVFYNEYAVVCTKCRDDILYQLEDFEKNQVPQDKRNYRTVLPIRDTKNAMAERRRLKSGTDGSVSDHSGSQSPIDLYNNSRPGSGSSTTTEKTDSDEAGLPQGSKPPPLTMVTPANNKITRTTATVPPLNQTSPSGSITAISQMTGNAALNATRQSSFAAALRKLAKQAEDPRDLPASSSQDRTREPSPARSNPSPREPTPKRTTAPSSLVYSRSQAGAINSPPVVTIAPTQSHNSISGGDARKISDRPSVVQSTTQMIEPMGIKQEREKMTPNLPQDRRDEERPVSKEGSTASTPKQLTPHSVISSTHDEMPHRGFQPYRPGDEVRGPGPHHLGLDPSYPYPGAFLPPPGFPHPAFRFDDPMLLERYRMMQASPLLPYGAHPGLQPPPGFYHQFLPHGMRYPAELLAQHLPLMPQSGKVADPRSPGASTERHKSEEELRKEREAERERELERQRELERERQRERERELQRERERQEKEEREKREREERKRQEEQAARYSSLLHGMPRDAHLDSRYSNTYTQLELQKHQEEARWREQERERQILLQKKEKERQQMHHQFLREQDLLLKERERHLKNEKREKSIPPPLTSPKVAKVSDEHQHPKTTAPSFHRPFESSLTNGYERAALSEYERRLMTESILAQDRRTLMENHNNQGSKIISHSNNHKKQERHQAEPNKHEGMHARLLESNDKYHNYQNNQQSAQQSVTRHLPQYEYDRPHPNFNNAHLGTHKPVVSSLGPEKQHQNSQSFKHELPKLNHTSYNHGMKLEPISPVMSKLDKEEKVLKDARVNGRYNSDESDTEIDFEDVEERKMQRLMMITEGPPLQLDKSPKKMRFLGDVGLTTTDKRRDVDFDRRCKRRKLYREKSLSPVEMAVEEPKENSSPLRVPRHIHPDDLNRMPDFRHRERFMSMMGLAFVPPERRRVMNVIRHACDKERRRRHGGDRRDDRTENHKHVRNRRVPSITQPQVQNAALGSKRKHHEMDTGMPEHQRISLSQLQERHLAASSSSSRHPSSSTSNHLSHSSPISSGRGHTTISSQGHAFNSSRHVIYPEHSSGSSSNNSDKERHRTLSREFAQEFHESVLQTTRQRQGINNSLVQVASNKHEDHNHVERMKSSRQSSSSPATHPTHNIEEAFKPTYDNSAVFKWPGIEVLMEAYSRHVDERKMETTVLTEQCHRLQTENRELTKSSERLNVRMTELLHKKEQQDTERLKLQSAVDNLKKCLKIRR